jgi:hypothetical protein
MASSAAMTSPPPFPPPTRGRGDEAEEKQMDETMVTVLEILGPAVLLVLLIWLAMRGRSNRGRSTPEQESQQASEQKTEHATRRLYKEEEQRRREGTDGAED